MQGEGWSAEGEPLTGVICHGLLFCGLWTRDLVDPKDLFPRAAKLDSKWSLLSCDWDPDARALFRFLVTSVSLKLGKRLKSFNAHVDLAFRPPFSSSVSKTDFDFTRIAYFYSLSLSYGS